MNIHIITIAYGLADDLRKLYESAVSGCHEVTWHIFLHSQFNDVMAACLELSNRPNVRLYPYGQNRGLARSWNEGIRIAYDSGADVVIISNDDIVLSLGDLDELAEAAIDQRQHYIVTCHGYDRRTNTFGSMNSGFFALNPIALAVLGWYDENFFPIYYEDIDYARRAALVGLTAGHCPNTNVVHQGSKSIHTVVGLMEQHQRTFEANRNYYIKKWGGDKGEEKYDRPFNNERFGLHILSREHPYDIYDRTDFDLVRM